MHELPSELIGIILGHLTNLGDITSSLLVCSRWRDLTLIEETWQHRLAHKYTTNPSPTQPAKEEFLQAEEHISLQDRHDSLVYCMELNYWVYIWNHVTEALSDRTKLGVILCAAVDANCWPVLHYFANHDISVFQYGETVTLKNATYWQSMGSNIWSIRMQRPTPLHIAVCRGNEEAIEWLLHQCGERELWAFIGKSCKEITLLNSQDPKEEYKNVNVFHWCAVRGESRIMQLVLDVLSRASPVAMRRVLNSRCKDYIWHYRMEPYLEYHSVTAWHLALLWENPDCAQLLLDAGADDTLTAGALYRDCEEVTVPSLDHIRRRRGGE